MSPSFSSQPTLDRQTRSMTNANSTHIVPSMGYEVYGSAVPHATAPSSPNVELSHPSGQPLIARRASYSSQPTVGISVVDFHPTEGEEGVPITVNVRVREGLAQTVLLRFVLGSKPLETSVSPTSVPDIWMLQATAPAAWASPNGLRMTVEALSPENQVLESITFGQFQYWESDRTALPVPPLKKRRHTVVEASSNLHHVVEDKAAPRRHSISHQTPLTMLSNNDSRIRKKKLIRRSKAQALRKAPEGVRAESVTLTFTSSLEAICRNWTVEERAIGRRLVRFKKSLRGRTLQISCEPIVQEQFQDADTVISCISREDEPGAFYFTSVDIIYLLERLVDERFLVEEKNRIRRNLEGLRPTTVSKHRAGVERFFQRIMDFPEPKPRNIEKDLKVFEWRLLGQALEKIISKYSLYSYDSTTTSSPSSPSISLSTPRESPEMSLPPAYLPQETRSKSPSNDSFPELTYPSSGSSSPPLYANSTFSNVNRVDEFLPFITSIGSSPNPIHTPSTLFTFPAASTEISAAYDSNNVLVNGNGSWLPDDYMTETEVLSDYYHLETTYAFPGPYDSSQGQVPRSSTTYM